MTRPTPPPCPIIDFDGRRAVVHLWSPHDTVGDLARALTARSSSGAPETVTAGLCIDGTTVDGHVMLSASGMRAGSVLTPARRGPRDMSAPDTAEEGVIEWAVVAGPSCSSWRRLEPGRHIVGRAPDAAVGIEDPGVEPHHGFLDVDADGTVWFVQLTGRVRARVGERVSGPREVIRSDEVLRIGASAVAFRARTDIDDVGGRAPSTTLASAPGDPWHRVVQRQPRVAEVPVASVRRPDALVVDPWPTPIGLVGAVLGAATAGVIGIVGGQAMFAVFALAGAVASAGGWSVGALSTTVRRRRARHRYRAEVAECRTRLALAGAANRVRHVQRHPSIVDVLAAGDDVWGVRGTDLDVTVGVGTVRCPLPLADDGTRASFDPALAHDLVASEELDGVSVPVGLHAGATVALRGDPSMSASLMRAVVLQLAVRFGPVDVRLLVVSSRPASWEWMNWLPHAVAGGVVAPDAVDRALSDADTDDGAVLVVVTDAPGVLTARTAPLRRLLAAERAICLVATTDAVPVVTSTIVDVGATGVVCVDARQRAMLAGVSARTAEAVARTLAPLADPEIDGGSSMLRDVVGLGELLRAGPGGERAGEVASILRRWDAAGSDPAPRALLGLAADGPVEIDLVTDGPHGLVAGTTGAGKSELLRTWVVGLALGCPPDQLSMVLVDFKGGATFDACARLPHVAAIVTDLDDGLAERALVSLDAELRRRESMLRAVAAEDLAAYRRVNGEPLARLVVIVDEFAGLAKEFPDFLSALVAIAQRGRSLGVHLVLATQRPAGVITDEIRANTNLRLALRVNDRADAVDVVGDGRAASLPRSAPGRCVMRLGHEELIVMQTAACTLPVVRRAPRLRVDSPGRDDDDVDVAAVTRTTAPTELDLLVDAIADAAEARGSPRARPLWVDPLPVDLDVSELAPFAGAADPVVGLVDDPANQRRLPLSWDPSSGNLLLVGAVGSGTTSAALAIVAAVTAERSPAALHLYVLDGRGDPRWDDVARLAHCAAVIRVGESERLGRAVDRLAASIEARASSRDGEPDVVVVVDGLDPVRAAIGDLDPLAGAVRFDRVLREGHAVGIGACVIADLRAADVARLAVSQCWTFGPRPGRVVIEPSGSIGHVATGWSMPRAVRPGERRGLPRPIEVLSPVVTAEDLAEVLAAQAAPAGAAPTALALGVCASTLGVARLDVGPGDHVLVAGGARSGVSSVLARVAESWSTTHRDGRVVHVGYDTPRSAFEYLGENVAALAGPLLIVIDDADRVDDASGMLRDLITARVPGVTIAAGVRLEAARAAYGHWVREVARSRCGVIMTGPGDVDGDLLGVTLPRRSTIAPRPGLGWLIDGRGHRLVQVATTVGVRSVDRATLTAFGDGEPAGQRDRQRSGDEPGHRAAGVGHRAAAGA